MNEILTGDALTILKTLPSESVQCIVTSPPYYALRDYGVDGQIGLEETPAAFIAKLVGVFREARRVLRHDGTCWVNIGDTYANDEKSGGHPSGKHCKELHEMKRPRRFTGLPGKNLIGIPWRLAFALQDDGWILRSDVVWAKPNPLPESVTDRPTRSHEYIFMLTKEPHYYYDASAIRKPSVSDHPSGNGFKRDARLSYLNSDGTSRGNDEQWQMTPYRNKRDVWTVASHPYPEAHFATFPPKLIEPCIMAGTSPRACEHCGAPWERQTERTPMIIRNGPISGHYGSRTTDSLSGTMLAPAETRTIGWQPTCTCEGNTGVGKCVVLDPFCGAGTTEAYQPRPALGRNRGSIVTITTPTADTSRITTLIQQCTTVDPIRMELARLTLATAVPVAIANLQESGGPQDYHIAAIQERAAQMRDNGSGGADLQFGGTFAGEEMALFCDMIAVMAFCPGGVNAFGMHFEASVESERAA